jgi:hypothetical protein
MNTRSRFITIMHPLPQGIAGGGSVRIGGKDVAVFFYNGEVVDKRRWKRMQRRAAAANKPS